MKATDTLKIFIVEDNLIYSEILSHEVEKFTKNIRCFRSGEECLRYIDESPDLVILDHKLEGKLTGIEVLQKIKMLNAKIKVLFLTAQEKISLALDSIKYGAEAYLNKSENIAIPIKKNMISLIKGLELKKEEKYWKRALLIGVPALLIMTFAVLWLHQNFPGIFNI